MKVKVSDLDGRALNWAVAFVVSDMHRDIGNGQTEFMIDDKIWVVSAQGNEEDDTEFDSSGNWAHGGPLIEHYGIELEFRQCPKTAIGLHDTMTENGIFITRDKRRFTVSADISVLFTACRAIVFQTHGYEIEIPDELCEVTPCK